MRKLLWGFAVVFTASIIILACQKELSSPKDASTKFDDKAAKEWYYGTFKKSPEWASSSQKGKKLPDWKHPVAGKIANHDVIEFPLIEATKRFALPGSTTISPEDKKRLADASMSRILFIKNKDNSISVKEIDYIPDWQYVESRNFDISEASVLKPNNDFSGRIIIKDWNESIASLGMIENGHLIKVGKILTSIPTHRTQDEECTTSEFCIYQMDCVVTYYGDGMSTEECGEWHNTGKCWTEEYCTGGDVCEMYGLCDDDPGNECANAQNIFDDIVASGHPMSQSEQITLTSSTPTIKNKTYKWNFFLISSAFNSVNFSSRENGVLELGTSGWKFQSLAHFDEMKVGTSVLWSTECTNRVATPTYFEIPIPGTGFTLSYAKMDLD